MFYIPLVVDLAVALLVVALPAVFFVAAAVVLVVEATTFPLGLAVPALFDALLTLSVLELFLIATDVVALVVLVVSVIIAVVLRGEVDDSTFARFTTGPFCGKDTYHYQCVWSSQIKNECDFVLKFSHFLQIMAKP